jgi:hypothetical protein
MEEKRILEILSIWTNKSWKISITKEEMIILKENNIINYESFKELWENHDKVIFVDDIWMEYALTEKWRKFLEENK